MNVQPLINERPSQERVLAARLEPFDSYWQAPRDIEAGFDSFTAYYRANYLSHLPQEDLEAIAAYLKAVPAIQ